jgi:glycosyltransferase involved in cell wall biosynthesis
MKIAFDLRRITNPGIGRYMKCLVESVLAQGPEHDYLLIMLPGTEEMIQVSGSQAEKLSSRLKYYSLREQIELPRILRSNKIDLLHSPHFMLPLRRPCPCVVTIHDVIYLACKADLPSRVGRLYYRAMMAASVRLADRIITDSEFSKGDIIRHLSADPAKIQVIYPGVSKTFQPVTDAAKLSAVRSKYGIGEEYVLYTGIDKPRKNHAGLLRAFQRFKASNTRIQLVIAGPINERADELKRLAEELDISHQFVLAGFVDDCDLPALYSGARVYACPSLYEGFGFTVLEAMACGTPVVCSTETSLPEIAGDAALYADPRSPEQFGHALDRVFHESDLRRALIRNGHNNLQRFSWNQAAAQMLSIYRQALGIPFQREVCV